MDKELYTGYGLNLVLFPACAIFVSALPLNKKMRSLTVSAETQSADCLLSVRISETPVRLLSRAYRPDARALFCSRMAVWSLGFCKISENETVIACDWRARLDRRRVAAAKADSQCLLRCMTTSGLAPVAFLTFKRLERPRG